jgi:hypothetical protein
MSVLGPQIQRLRSPSHHFASDTSIQAALEPVKLFEGIGKGGRDVGGRLAVQPISLDQPGTGGRLAEGASQVSCRLGVVLRTPSTGGVSSRHSQPSESDVVHDHVRLRQHQIVAIACLGVRIGARHMEHAGTTQRGETVGGSSCAAYRTARVGNAARANVTPIRLTGRLWKLRA